MKNTPQPIPRTPRRQAVLSKYQNDLTGVRFGTLTVVAYEGKTPRNNSLWTCVCDCGGHRRGVAYQSLMQGLTRGCVQCTKAPSDVGRKGGRSKTRHINQHIKRREEFKKAVEDLWEPVKDWI